MLLRGERLGEISDDVLEFISSRDADRHIFEADLLVDRAHLVMLKERGLIAAEELSEIVAALDGIELARLGEGEDVHEAIEAELIARVGAVGGRMHTARSRNDEVATCIRIVLREELLGLMAEVNGLAEALIERAGEHKETVIPGFTHLQHAQPTTLAHHLLAHADALLRDFDRLRDSLPPGEQVAPRRRRLRLHRLSISTGREPPSSSASRGSSRTAWTPYRRGTSSWRPYPPPPS